MQVVTASFTVKCPGTRPGNSVCGTIFLLQGLHWNSGPLSWLLPGLCCVDPMLYFSDPDTHMLLIPMSLPSQPRTFSRLVCLSDLSLLSLIKYSGPDLCLVRSLPCLSPMLLGHFPLILAILITSWHHVVSYPYNKEKEFEVQFGPLDHRRHEYPSNSWDSYGLQRSVKLMTKMLHMQLVYFVAVINNLFISVLSYTQGVILLKGNFCGKLF